ncbi:MAG: hypothetical protein WCD18_13220, partial [Thermosynechococcaceae cyanobacterium]
MDNIQEQSREAAATQRLHEEQMRDSMEIRAEEELEQRSHSSLDEAAREAVAKDRLKDTQLQENMKERTEEALGG